MPVSDCFKCSSKLTHDYLSYT
uniref:Uncharacterized protein n=1 Tax=Anguilla anguilla TaxID=7936 RepID=A0A0E9RGD8_ANGAN